MEATNSTNGQLKVRVWEAVAPGPPPQTPKNAYSWARRPRMVGAFGPVAVGSLRAGRAPGTMDREGECHFFSVPFLPSGALAPAHDAFTFCPGCPSDPERGTIWAGRRRTGTSIPQKACAACSVNKKCTGRKQLTNHVAEQGLRNRPGCPCDRCPVQEGRSRIGPADANALWARACRQVRVDI